MAAPADPISPSSLSRLASPTPTSSSNKSHPVRDTTAFPMTTEQMNNGTDYESSRNSSPSRGRAKAASESQVNGSHRAQHSNDRGERYGKSRSTSASVNKTPSSDNVQRLSASEMHQLTSSPDSLPIGPAPPKRESFNQDKFSEQREAIRQALLARPEIYSDNPFLINGLGIDTRGAMRSRSVNSRSTTSRTLSTPPTSRIAPSEPTPSDPISPRRLSLNPNPAGRPSPLNLSADGKYNDILSNGMLPSPAIKSAHPVMTSATPEKSSSIPRVPSPMPPIIPLPPMSVPTHLQLELAAQRPSPLYIHHSHTSDIPYESNAVKFERLKNVLLLPTYLERTLYFGALACLDAWLHTFTILPIRFFIAVAVLIRWWAYVLRKESSWMVGFVWYGIGRVWSRVLSSEPLDTERSRSRSTASEPSVAPDAATPSKRARVKDGSQPPGGSIRDPGPERGSFRHRRTKSIPSALSAFHKADLLQGLVIICSSIALMSLDASRMYHFIRAQSAIKLYVIYNILEVSDRLLSALGQDILECLFSSETLSRNASGRSKILLPLGMFFLALAYNCLHSIALYYQVITLNVAVNSYSNALLTLLLSNQFVEIKSTVFKRFEKDNLFQLTCADIVERFHLWIMLLIIGMRNLVEVGGFSVPGAGLSPDIDDMTGSSSMNSPSILPHSFTVLPSWLMSGEVLSPFLIVVGSEMLVDTIKHAYVTKFNNIKPKFYSRTLDILCKDYYTHAFQSPSLTRRLGLAVIPLSCLFIRASIQTYHMFLSTYLPMPIPQSTQTSLAEESATPSSPAMMAALNRFDALIRDSLGRVTYGYQYGTTMNARPWYSWSSDNLIATLTMIIVFFIAFLVLLIVKLLLGMLLLKYSRNRYAKMKQQEQLVALGKAERESYDSKGRRVGGRGEVEVGDERQRWIHADKTEGLRGGKGPGGKRTGEEKKPAEGEYNGVFRYEMVNKRIW